ncbi:E3 ubiquitin-protein ligase RFWD3 [Phymastichus coffea]|uniref:E3 ubiquitin-protein ligase RFWD3 n=1 Tax=Phymastichus coffea TaxID=108790 RepID=UPI00273CD22A|nr:E3 ubiquitin-protein ligase RFWD3 [Phymastichus coffea]
MEDDDDYSDSSFSLFDIYDNSYLSELYRRLTAETNSMSDDNFSDSSDSSSMYEIPDQDFDENVEVNEDVLEEDDDSSSDAMSDASTVVTGEDQLRASQSGTETEVENEEQSNEEIVQSQKKIKLDETVENQPGILHNDSSDEDQRCPICLEVWSNAGEHRLCSLRCGHLFGLKCITQWFSVAQNACARKCPECNTKASKKDIRVLYAKSLRCVDTSEIEELKMQLKDAITQKETFQKQVVQFESKEVVYKQQINNLKLTISDLRKQVEHLTSTKSSFLIQYKNNTLQERKVFDICKSDSCRVMAYNPWYKNLVVCAGNMVNKICMSSLVITSKTPLHKGPIRDIAFQEQHQNYLLTVGFDKKVMLSDIRTHILVHSFAEHENLWSCCWSNYSSYNFFAGGNKGIVIEYDIRNLRCGVATRENAEDKTPVVSIASVPSSSPAFSAGGYLACQFNSCYAYCFKEGSHVGYKIDIEGPFASLRYNERDNHVLLSCKPTLKHPTRHIVCSIAKSNDKILFNQVHTFTAGNCQKYLARPCYMNLQNDTMVVASNESENLIMAWSISSGQQAYTISIPSSESVLDVCAFETGSDVYQAVLTRNKLQLFCHT